MSFLFGRGGRGLDRSRRLSAGDGRAIAVRERDRDVQWTYCRVDVAGFVGTPPPPRESASSDSEEDDEDHQSGEWLVLHLLLELLGASRRWRLPVDQLRGGRSKGLPSAADESEAEGSRTVVGLPVEGKPVVAPRPEPLVCSQAKGWGRGLPPCQIACA